MILDPTGTEPGTLIHNVTRLKRFAAGGDLYGRLVYIDPTDRHYTVPINLLSLRATLTDDDAISSAISSYVSIMGGLMGQPLTPYQDPPLRYAVQVALAFDRPKLDTLRRIISPPNDREPSAYWKSVRNRLHPTVQSYMDSTFDVQTVRRSRGEIMSRLYSLSADPIFRRLFEAEETKIDLAKEINEPKVIVINADRDYLRSLKELYGRYFLALIKAAGESRPASSIPCFIYIDECDEFVKHDENAAEIIYKLRRKRIALSLGNQEVHRIEEPRGAFLGTAIKFANCNLDSAKELAPMMGLIGESGRADIQPLVNRPPLNFAYFIRGRMKQPETFKFEPGIMESQPRMTEEEWEHVRQEIRDRYYVPIKRETTQAPPDNIILEEQLHIAPSAAPSKPKSQRTHSEPKSTEPPEPPVTPEQRPNTEGASGWS